MAAKILENVYTPAASDGCVPAGTECRVVPLVPFFIILLWWGEASSLSQWPLMDRLSIPWMVDGRIYFVTVME